MATNLLEAIPLYVYGIVTQLNNAKQVTPDNAAITVSYHTI